MYFPLNYYVPVEKLTKPELQHFYTIARKYKRVGLLDLVLCKNSTITKIVVYESEESIQTFFSSLHQGSTGRRAKNSTTPSLLVEQSGSGSWCRETSAYNNICKHGIVEKQYVKFFALCHLVGASGDRYSRALRPRCG